MLVVFLAQHLKEIGGYPEFRRSQDYALWELFLSKGYKLANQDFVGQVFWDPVSFKRVGFSSLDQEFRVLAHRYSINWNLNFKHVCIYVLKISYRFNALSFKDYSFQLSSFKH